MADFYEKLEGILKQDERFVSDDGDLIKSEIINMAYNIDEILITRLLGDEDTKAKFFKNINGNFIFNISLFVDYIQDKKFLIDSYTKFSNKIGLTIDGKKLEQRGEVSLVWPFKDCVLEGGMDNEEANRKEIFFNEILADDEITRLKEPKVLTNAKKYNTKGSKAFDGFNRDENGTITDNLIIKGNNLLALHSLYEEFAGKVKLIYIDPPYNTGSDSFKYNDKFSSSSWLTFMKNRLEIAKKLLSEDGSIYISIDYNEAHYLKVLMDEIFDRNNFQREIIWRIGWLSGYKTKVKNYIRNHDTILFYSKNSDKFLFNKIKSSFLDYNERFNNDQRSEIKEKLNDLGVANEQAKDFLNYISKIGLPETSHVEDTWNASFYDKLNSIAVVSFSHEKVSKLLDEEEFKGQKPEKLLKRIIENSTNEKDIVLDFHLGTGTTAAVAHKMNRQYIGIEQMSYIENVAVERVKKVIAGDNVGISKFINWQGGGEFIYFELKEYNEEFINRIRKAKNSEALNEIWKYMKEKSFFKYNVDFREQEKAFEEWEKLNFEEQQKALISLLDKNHLYVNYLELEDENFECTDKEKKLTNEFYNKA